MGNLVTVQITQVAESLGLGSVDPVELRNTLIATAFNNGDKKITDEQMAALLIVAGQYKLNPWTKEIYAFPSTKGIIPVVGVDGWSRIINGNDALSGMEFSYAENSVRMQGALVDAPEWIECIITRSDRQKPIVVREYLDECYQKPRGNFAGPWQTHPKRFLRHKAMIQCARLAFGFVGIYDKDEAERIQDNTIKNVHGQSTDSIPVGYLEFEASNLEPMRELASEGLEALQTGYAELPSGECKNYFWSTHSQSLKDTAQRADQPKGETYEHSPA